MFENSGYTYNMKIHMLEKLGYTLKCEFTYVGKIRVHFKMWGCKCWKIQGSLKNVKLHMLEKSGYTLKCEATYVGKIRVHFKMWGFICWKIRVLFKI